MANADLVRYIHGGLEGYYDRVPLGVILLPNIVGNVEIGQISGLRNTLVVSKEVPATAFEGKL